MPSRIQLSRGAGWRKPKDAIVVARPTRFGNPYPVVGGDRTTAVAKYREWLTDTRVDHRRPTLEEIAELRGHDLACWCPLDQPCHADVLLRIANDMSPASNIMAGYDS